MITLFIILYHVAAFLILFGGLKAVECSIDKENHSE